MDPDSKKSKVSMMTVRSHTGTKSSAIIAQANKSLSRMKMRKPSYGFGNVPGIRIVEGRNSQIGMEFKRPPLIFHNTYQLDSHVKFHVPSVIKAANAVLDTLFTDHKYNFQESPGVTLRIAGEIMRNVKYLGFNRYRIITVVTMGQKRAQSYNNAVAFLWDHERDGIVDLQREVTSAFIQVTIFGVYLD